MPLPVVGVLLGQRDRCNSCHNLPPHLYLIFSFNVQILASYLVQKGPEYFRGKNIVEIGSGTGLVGLVVGAFRNADVWITDQA